MKTIGIFLCGLGWGYIIRPFIEAFVQVIKNSLQREVKITKRHWYSAPVQTIHMWLIPTSLYTLHVVAGTQFNQYEWLWWVVTTSTFTLWFFINFKVTFNTKEK